jgi:hypothetical protein
MPADRRHHKCHPRTIEEFQKKLSELRKWAGIPPPPARFQEDWFAGLCAEPCQFTEQLVKLRDALQSASESEPARVP